MVEAAGTATWSDRNFSGGPMVGYGVTDAIAVEGGGEISSSAAAIGYAGVRYTPLRPEGRSYAFTLDLEGGFGAGVGGTRCEYGICETNAQDWRRPAGGGYLGIGIGGKIKWFSPWLRLRTQLSAAEKIPVTSLTTAGLGVQFTINDFAHIYLGTGVYLLANETIVLVGQGYLDGGVSFTIATPRTRRLHDQREQREQRAQR
jgi:hypothetical protein